MRSCFARPAHIFAFTTILATYGFASPLGSKLLPLVPAGSQIVVGFDNRHDATSSGRFILATENNRLDLEDWVSLTGVDNTRIFDEVIEVAASSSRGEIREHLLLVAGHFDQKRIFHSAELNGATISGYGGEKTLIFKPFTREQGRMLDERWLIILNDRTGLLGTAPMVQEALHRYAAHASTDPILTERLAEIRPDVTSWNVLVSTPMVVKHVAFVQSGAWSRMLEDAELLTVGARFGPKVRVDFAVHAKADRKAADFPQKAECFYDVFTEPASLDAGLSSHPRLEHLSIEPSRVQGSIDLTRQEFNHWVSSASLHQIAQKVVEPAPAATTGVEVAENNRCNH